jgi:cytosine/adenosine deaminase-related metal-dependent hydrolase
MNSGFVFTNGTVVNSDRWFRADLRVRGSLVDEIGAGMKVGEGEIEIDCSNCFIYPGLINSHEHLEFNLFSRLGEPPYPNAYEWGDDLHRRWKSEIAKIDEVPFRHRLWWGAWKNLFSGVTRVVHHNPYYVHFRMGYPVDVVKRYTWAHSLRFDADLKGALARRKAATPFVIHLAEGRDDESFREVAELDQMGGIDDRTVAVHAIAIDQPDVELLIRNHASVVWCPSSNSYLFHRTTPIHYLHGRVPVALGTDSSLSGSISLFEELRVARNMSSLPGANLFEMVTSVPRRIFNLSSDAGAIVEKGRADLFVTAATAADPYERLTRCEPGDICLLMAEGKVVLSDESTVRQMHASLKPFPLLLNGNERYVWPAAFAKRFVLLRPHLLHYSYLS